MSTWIYRQTEPTLWTVGTMWRDGGGGDRFDPESDHGTAEEAALRVRFLNGGGPVGICGARLHDSTGAWSHLFVCTKTPGHLEQGDRLHTDATRNGAPAATWSHDVPNGAEEPDLEVIADGDQDSTMRAHDR